MRDLFDPVDPRRELSMIDFGRSGRSVVIFSTVGEYAPKESDSDSDEGSKGGRSGGLDGSSI